MQFIKSFFYTKNLINYRNMVLCFMHDVELYLDFRQETLYSKTCHRYNKSNNLLSKQLMFTISQSSTTCMTRLNEHISRWFIQLIPSLSISKYYKLWLFYALFQLIVHFKSKSKEVVVKLLFKVVGMSRNYLELIYSTCKTLIA